MTDLSYSSTDQELREEVRDALGGLDGTKIPDDTIIQTADTLVVPLLNDIAQPLKSEDQEKFDSAVIMWTAELSFNAWMTFTRLRDREVETYVDPKQYLSQLEQRTNLALRLIGATRPPEIPNHVVTIKHDGKYRKIDLQKHWETV